MRRSIKKNKLAKKRISSKHRRTKSRQMKSCQMKSRQMKSRQMKSRQMKSRQAKSRRVKSRRKIPSTKKSIRQRRRTTKFFRRKSYVGGNTLTDSASKAKSFAKENIVVPVKNLYSKIKKSLSGDSRVESKQSISTQTPTTTPKEWSAFPFGERLVVLAKGENNSESHGPKDRAPSSVLRVSDIPIAPPPPSTISQPSTKQSNIPLAEALGTVKLKPVPAKVTLPSKIETSKLPPINTKVAEERPTYAEVVARPAIKKETKKITNITTPKYAKDYVSPYKQKSPK